MCNTATPREKIPQETRAHYKQMWICRLNGGYEDDDDGRRRCPLCIFILWTFAWPLTSLDLTCNKPTLSPNNCVAEINSAVERLSSSTADLSPGERYVHSKRRELRWLTIISVYILSPKCLATWNSPMTQQASTSNELSSLYLSNWQLWTSILTFSETNTVFLI